MLLHLSFLFSSRLLLSLLPRRVHNNNILIQQKQLLIIFVINPVDQTAGQSDQTIDIYLPPDLVDIAIGPEYPVVMEVYQFIVEHLLKNLGVVVDQLALSQKLPVFVPELVVNGGQSLLDCYFDVGLDVPVGFLVEGAVGGGEEEEGGGEEEGQVHGK